MVYRFVKISIVIILLLTGCLTQEPVEVIDKRKNYYSKSGAIQIILVKEGDTIKSIAKKYKTTPKAILQSNGLHPDSNVMPGMSLIISKEGKHDTFEASNEDHADSNEEIASSQLKPLNASEQSQGNNQKAVTGYLVSKSKTINNENNQEIITKKDIITEKPKQEQVTKAYEENNTKKQEAEAEDLDLTKEHEEVNAAASEKNVEKTSSAFKVSSPLNSDQFDWPVEGKVISRYGKVGNRFNDGINIAAPFGTPVVVAAEGKVIYIGENIEGYGNMVIVKHEGDYMTAYAHLKDVVVERGAKVKRGESLGTVGQSGNINQSQLHFSIRKGKKTIDPELSAS